MSQWACQKGCVNGGDQEGGGYVNREGQQGGVSTGEVSKGVCQLGKSVRGGVNRGRVSGLTQPNGHHVVAVVGAHKPRAAQEVQVGSRSVKDEDLISSREGLLCKAHAYACLGIKVC